jgi:HK97 family phage major capsid protein/HK97 family phage prohead protease
MDLMRDLEGQTHRRAASLEDAAINVESRLMEFSFSSEHPVQRYFGNEVLSHERGAVDLGRLNDGAPVLFNHDPSRVIGVVQRAWIDNEKMRGMVSVKFSRNAFAQEVMTDIHDKVMRNISVGYSIGQMEERGDNFVATSWSPYEVSVVGIPADPTIGIGRKLDTDDAAPAATPTPTPSPTSMEDTNLNIEAVRAEAAAQAANAERTRIASISALTERHGLKDLGATLIENGRSIDEARAAVLEKISAKPVETVKPVDMDQRDASRFNITAGIRAALSGDWSSYEAGLVREMSAEVQKSMGRAPSAERAFFVPFSALTRATYVTSGASTGGNLVQTDLLDQDFIEFLRNRSVMLAAGVRTMPGLQGNVAIPRRSGVASTYYLSSQTTAITQSESTFDQVTLSPKNLAALSKYSRQTLLQATPGIEQLVRTDLIDGINVAMDLGILNGSGSSGQPTGIMQTSGIGSVAIGTNGGAITLEALVNLETELTIDNVPVDRNSVSYITNAKVMGNLKKLRAGGSTTGDGPFLVNDNLLAIGRGGTPSVVNGYPVYVTNQVPSNLTKGSSSSVCSAVVIGDYSQAMVGLWGNGLEITVGEDQDDFSKALTSVRGIVSYDVAVRDPKCFAACLDVTTS